MKRILLFFLLLGKLYAQNWAPINITEKFNYDLGNTGYVTNTVWVDSFDVIQEDTIMYLNRIVTLCDTCPEDLLTELPCNNCYYLDNQPQFLQRHVTKGENGVYIFSDTSEFIIFSLAQLHDTWVFDSSQSITAEVTSIYVENIFGFTEQVKHITLANGKYLKLSKNFGILEFPDFKNDTLNYELIGIEGRDIGEIVPDFWDFFDFNVGDVFEYHFNYGDPGYSEWLGKKYTIVEKAIYDDSVKYLIDVKLFDRNWGEVLFLEHIIDTIIFVDSINHVTNLYNKQLSDLCNQIDYLWICDYYESKIVYAIVHHSLNEKGLYLKKFGGSWHSSLDPLLMKTDLFNDLLVSSKIYNFGVDHLEIYYIEGIGRQSYFLNDFEINFDEILAGYIKNGDTVGIITPDSLLMPIKDLEPIEYNINIYPNPASGFFKISISENYLEAIVELYDLNGKILYTEKYNSGEEMLIELSEKHSGIYIIKILVNDTVIHKKLIFN